MHVIQEAAWDLLCALRTCGDLPDRMLAEFAMELSELLASSRGLTLHDVRSARMRARLVAGSCFEIFLPTIAVASNHIASSTKVEGDPRALTRDEIRNVQPDHPELRPPRAGKTGA